MKLRRKKKRPVKETIAYEMEKCEEYLETLKAILLACDNKLQILEITAISGDRKMFIRELCKKYELTTFQAEVISDLRIRSFTKGDMYRVKEEYQEYLSKYSNLKKMHSIVEG